MRHLPHYLALLVGLLLATPGTSSADITENGTRYNGTRYNGTRYNGTRYNGTRYNGTELGGVDTSGAALGSLRLDGSLIVGSYANAPDSACGDGRSETVVGAPLSPGCSKCAEIVQTNDPTCLLDWHAGCVDDARTLCSFDSYDLVGATFTTETVDGSAVQLRIDSVEQVPPVYEAVPVVGSEFAVWFVNVNADVLMYEVKYLREGSCFTLPWLGKTFCWPDSWQPICDYTDDDGVYNRALAVDGMWADCEGEAGCGGRTGEAGWTFACRDGAIAKCVERIGYKPWKEIDVCNSMEYVYPYDPDPANQPDPDAPPTCWTDTLADHHEACVRMLRADYCGDGVSHTVDGTEINIYDIDETSPSLQGYAQSPAHRPTWGFEANWAPHGAQCIAEERFNGPDPAGGDQTIAEYIDANCVERLDQNLHTSQHCQAATSWNVVSNALDEDNRFLPGTRDAYVSNTSKSLAKWVPPTLPDFPGDLPGKAKKKF